MNKEQLTTTKADNFMNGTLAIPNTEALGKLENAETGMSLTVTYKMQEDWVKGEAIRCFFLGLKEIPNDKGENVLCAGFMNKSEVFLAGQMVLIDAVRGLAIGTALEIVFNGKKQNKTSAGSTNLFTVRLLNIV